MKDRWEKGDPVNLSDLLRITPVANEIIRLGGELNMKQADILWIVSEIIRDCDYEDGSGLTPPDVSFGMEALDDECGDDDDWEADEEDLEDASYRLFMKVQSKGKFPEVSFKAGMNEREDLRRFLNMVIEILDRMEL
ncbi:MAG: hypothetical protein ACM3QZ_07925 [Solirubrobacterales bacterium]